jgi:peptidoglycan/xylan/chitin deacetylase (PgdA/CDA1 family)
MNYQSSTIEGFKTEANNNLQSGILTISLDFELYWGMRELVSLNDENFRQRLLVVYRAIPAILELFDRYNIHATWAVVGFLYFNNAKELQANLPDRLPQYKNLELSPYPDIKTLDSTTNKFHFCPELIELIKQYPGQEIGTHTFSHYYCLEAGQTKTEFQADLQAANKAAQQVGIENKSLVFPRNQYNREYLDTIAQLGITSYRGNEHHWMYNSVNGDGNSLIKRLLRLADSYINLSGHNCYSIEQLKNQYPSDIPASRFLRSYSAKLKYLDRLKLKRISSSLSYAARTKSIYHLWWHPHNFGENLDRNLEFLEKILVDYQQLHERNKMQSLNMGEIAEHLTLNI